MKIVRKENGNVLLTDHSGNTIKRLPEYAVLELKSDREGEFIRVAYGHQNKHDIYSNQITSTQIEPAAEVVFNGTGQDLLNLLSTSFFFEVSSAGGGTLENFYKTSQYHLMTGQGGRIFQTFPTPANSYYLRKIKVLDTIDVAGLAIEVINPLVGNAVAGVYSLDENGSPSNLLFQTDVEFDLSVAGVQEISLTSPYTLNSGTYAVGYIASSTVSTRSISRPLPSWGQDKTLLAAENNWIQSPAPYSPIMASIFPTDLVSVSVTQATAVLFSLA